MLVKKNMKHVYWTVRNLQLMLKALGAVRNHLSPSYDTLKCAVTGRQIAELAIAKYHFKGSLTTDKELDDFHEELARAKFGLVGAQLGKFEITELKERFGNKTFESFVQMRRISELCEALDIIAHNDLFKRPPWFSFVSSNDHLDKFAWSLPPDYE